MRSKFTNAPPKDENLSFRLAEEDKRRIFEAAERNGLTAGQFVRRAIAQALATNHDMKAA